MNFHGRVSSDKIIFLSFLFVCPLEGISNVLIFDVSQKKVSVSSDFKDEHFTIYGFSDSPKNLVLKITGPNQKVVLQKKTFLKIKVCVGPSMEKLS